MVVGTRQPRFVLAVAVFTALVSAAVCAAAILVPAPPIAVPFVVAICVGSPLLAGWEAPKALGRVRAQRAERTQRHAIAELRKSLAELPETEHPLDG